MVRDKKQSLHTKIEKGWNRIHNDPMVINGAIYTMYGRQLMDFYNNLYDNIWGQMICKQWVLNCHKKANKCKHTKERVERVKKYHKHFEDLHTERWFSYKSNNRTANNKPIISGHVYILSNIGMPGHLKIGGTVEVTPEDRADDLYHKGKTAVPAPFIVKYKRMTFDCWGSEHFVHESLGEERINIYREFFKIRLEKAKLIVDELITEHETSVFKEYSETKKDVI